MMFNIRSNLVLLTFCLHILHLSFADPLVNLTQRENTPRWREDTKYNVSSAIMKMTSRISLNGTLGWKQFSALQRNPGNFDFAFVVRPKQKVVMALKISLIASSPFLEREMDSYFTDEEMDKESILLPHFDSAAVKLFVELTILDCWSVEALKALELPSNQLLHLMTICHKFEMTSALKNLTELANDFVRNFGTYVKPENFLLLSQQQLGVILAKDDLAMKEMDVFNYACSWAEEQCTKQNLDVSGANMRMALGECLYQIRFPTMSVADFATVTLLKGLLSTEEIVKIFQFIGMRAKGSQLNFTTEFKFNTANRRTQTVTCRPPGSYAVAITKLYPVIDTSFVCDGKEKYHFFDMNIKIKLQGLGFLGPIDADSFYNVTVEIRKYTNGRYEVKGRSDKRVFAQKSQIFYFVFDQPIVLDSIRHDSWRIHYGIYFSLKGPNTRSLHYTHGAIKKINDNNKEFTISWRAPQLVEIVYNTF